MKLCANKPNYCIKTDVCVSITRPSLLGSRCLHCNTHETWANIKLQSDSSCFALWTPEGAAGLPLSNDVRCFLQSQTLSKLLQTGTKP